tara:strand:- start:59 stop:835 length:777 start_codon:yes stop_codon:yes gene_type:complete
MAQNKKSFILYCDLIDNIDHLTNEEKGLLFQHLLEYVNDKQPDELEDRVILSAWKPIKKQLKRDLQKFEEVREKRSEAGKISAQLRAEQKSTNSTSVESVKHRSTNPTDSDNDTVNDIFIKECTSPPNGVDALHFYIAKGYHRMFYDYKPNKTLAESKLNDWVKTVRLLIETDKIEPLHLITIKYFLQSGIDKEKGTDSFWSDTIYSINALRKKGKDGTYQFDRIKQDAKKWLSRNQDKEPLIYQAYNNLMSKVNGES